MMKHICAAGMIAVVILLGGCKSGNGGGAGSSDTGTNYGPILSLEHDFIVADPMFGYADSKLDAHLIGTVTSGHSKDGFVVFTLHFNKPVKASTAKVRNTVQVDIDTNQNVRGAIVWSDSQTMVFTTNDRFHLPEIGSLPVRVTLPVKELTIPHGHGYSGIFDQQGDLLDGDFDKHAGGTYVMTAEIR